MGLFALLSLALSWQCCHRLWCLLQMSADKQAPMRNVYQQEGRPIVHEIFECDGVLGFACIPAKCPPGDSIMRVVIQLSVYVRSPHQLHQAQLCRRSATKC